MLYLLLLHNVLKIINPGKLLYKLVFLRLYKLNFVYLFLVNADCGVVNAGVCVLNNTLNITVCKCDPSYGKPDCSYKRKSQVVAFGLELGLLFADICGAGRLYLGHVATGTLHLVSVFIAEILLCTASAILKGTSRVIPTIILVVIGSMILLTALIGQIIDIVLIGKGRLLDSNGYSMYMNM